MSTANAKRVTPVLTVTFAQTITTGIQKLKEDHASRAIVIIISISLAQATAIPKQENVFNVSTTLRAIIVKSVKIDTSVMH